MGNAEAIEIETTLEDLKVQKDRVAALRRLFKNKDFMEIINEAYIKEESTRLTLLLSEGDKQDDPEFISKVVQQLRAIANLSSFLRVLEWKGGLAERSYDEHLDLQRELDAEA